LLLLLLLLALALALTVLPLHSATSGTDWLQAQRTTGYDGTWIPKPGKVQSISCRRDGHGGRVTSIKLEYGGLTSLPEAISNLTALAELDLCHNSLTSLASLPASQAHARQAGLLKYRAKCATLARHPRGAHHLKRCLKHCKTNFAATDIN